MPIRRNKDIDTLYAEVADYDLVLVPDAPFASALNRRSIGPISDTLPFHPVVSLLAGVDRPKTV